MFQFIKEILLLDKFISVLSFYSGWTPTYYKDAGTGIKIDDIQK